MRNSLKNRLLISLGWLFVVLGFIGAILPLLPTTPFLILALALFSKSSPKFHQMLLNNQWFGPALKQWESQRALSRKIKYKVTILVLVTFSLSIILLTGRLALQMILVFLAIILLFYIWRLKEPTP